MSTAAKPVPFGPDLRSALVAMVRKRVPESEVEDIVQSALAEAIESPHAPADSESLRRWIFGVAKNKVVDYHRRAGRESFDLPDVPGTPAPHTEADLLRWAERNLPEGAENQKTLDWMLREGDGEKLESIAESEKLPPPRVRQRVSRLRRHFKENWQREVAMLAALGVIISAVVIFILRRQEPEPITHEVVDPRAEPVRRLALEKCAVADWKSCVDGLDEAKRLDPAGDTVPAVQQARQAAGNALKAPAPEPSQAPLQITPPPEPSSVTPPPLQKTKPESTAPPSFSATPPTPTPAPKMDGKPPAKPTTTMPTKPKASLGGSDSFGTSEPLEQAPTKDSKIESKTAPVPAGNVKGGGGKRAAPSK
ncbi:hypothetical protein BH11MYX4_BH11MYX4_15390 [soil metagenome]